MSLLVLVLGGAIIFGGMFLVDASSKLTTARHVQTAAQEAARAASEQVTSDVVTGRQAAVDPTGGAEAARTYLRTVGVTGSVSVADDTVTVSTSQAWQPRFLPTGGGTVTGVATADLIRR